MDIINANKTIAEWLGWDYGYFVAHTNLKHFWIKCNISELNDKCYLPLNLKFHSDSNWQWICLEKITKQFNEAYFRYGISDTLMFLENKHSTRKEISSKQDLFEAIYNYVLNEKEKS